MPRGRGPRGCDQRTKRGQGGQRALEAAVFDVAHPVVDEVHGVVETCYASGSENSLAACVRSNGRTRVMEDVMTQRARKAPTHRPAPLGLSGAARGP